MNKNTLKYIVVAAFILSTLMGAYQCFASDTIQYFDYGRINWSRGIIFAWGSAPVDESLAPRKLAEELAKRKSFIAAKKNLTEIVRKVKLDSKVSVEDLNESIRYVGAKINNVVKLADKKSSLTSTDKAKTSLILQIYGKLASSLMPHMGKELPDENPDKFLIEKMKQRKFVQSVSDIAQTPEEINKGEYSGLIVDARHLDIVPVLFPKITNEKRKEIYGISKFTSADIKKGNIVVYTKNLQSAFSSARAGKHPLVIRAVKNENDKDEIIISNADSRKIKFENKKSNFLEKGMVIIVLD